MKKLNIMKKLLFLLLFTLTFTACNTDMTSKELKVLDNSKSSELTFILELNTKNNSIVDVEAFTQELSNFIVERECGEEGIRTLDLLTASQAL